MKLTTVTSNNQKSSTPINAFKLKKMMQLAAENPVEHKSLYRINQSSKDTDDQGQFPKKFHKQPFLTTKTAPSVRDSEENKENIKVNANIDKKNNNVRPKIKMLGSAKSAKNLLAQGSSKSLIKSQSIKNLQVTKLRCLSRSVIKSQIIKKKEEFSITDFRLGKKLGRGRFGNVFLAQDKETGFIMALKVINKKQLKEAEMQDQLLQEIKLQSFMKHPNILEMYGFFDDKTNVYMMLELANQCLFKVLRKNINFPQKQAAYYMRQVNEGLKYMHSQNILHRDLKPQNIMLVNNVVKVADFGWSVYSPLYKRQTFCGTLDYVSPEVVKGDYYDEAIDIWSLGILLFQLTVGSAPFQGNTSQEQTLHRIVEGSYQIPQFLSEPLKDLIGKFLNKDPKKRCSLQELEQSDWIKLYEQEGRSISPIIWNFWQKMR